jgi:hypothetical protein
MLLTVVTGGFLTLFWVLLAKVTRGLVTLAVNSGTENEGILCNMLTAYLITQLWRWYAGDC